MFPRFPMFPSMGGLPCQFVDGTYDVTEVRFDEAGQLALLEMRFWQACRDGDGTFELRGLLHWVNEPGLWRAIV